DKPVVLVINKIDSGKHEAFAAEFDSLGFEPTISASAEHHRGILELLDAIERCLPSPAKTEGRPSNIEHSTGIAIVGRPNVGKSSLINSIVRSEREIVIELPGTPRDPIVLVYDRDAR